MLSYLKVIGFLIISFASIISGSAQSLHLGDWTGTLTPMNHPDMHLPMKYIVSEDNDNVTLTLVTENGTTTEARNIKMTKSTLAFVFNETDANVELTCHFNKDKVGRYKGKCQDKMGKWGLFTMIPPPE